jgi:hypothetical protein
MNNRRRLLPVAFALTAFIAAGVLAVPAYAWHSNLSTQIYANGVVCGPPGSSNPCGVPVGSSIYDKATLFLSSNGKPYGTISFVVYSGSSFTNGAYSANGYSIPKCTLGTGNTLKWTDSLNPQSVTGTGTTQYTSSTVNTNTYSTGSYFFYVTYSGTGKSGYPSASVCEPFSLSSTSTVPEFPLGMALLFALAIPVLLIARTRFARVPNPSLN